MTLVEDEKMVAVLSYLGSRMTWEKIRDTYENWADIFKPDRFKWLGLRDLDELAKVFYFKGQDIARCRNEFIYFLKQYQEFYNDNIEIVFQRMVEAREAYNTHLAQSGHLPIPFVNWIPDYGGRIQGSKRHQGEMEWHRENQIPFELDQFVPPEKKERSPPRRSRRSRRSEDDDDQLEDE